MSLCWDFLRQRTFAVDVLELSLDQLKQVVSGHFMGEASAERTGDVIHDEDAASSARRLSGKGGGRPVGGIRGDTPTVYKSR